MANIDWTRAKKRRPSTDTAATRKLEFRADRYLAAVDRDQAKRKSKPSRPTRTEGAS